MNSLRNRLLLGLLFWLILSLGLGIWGLSTGFRNAAERAFDARLNAYLYALAASGKDGLENLRPLGDPRFEQPLSGWYWQISEGNKALKRSRSLWDASLSPVSAELDGRVIYHRVEGPRGEKLRLVERDFILPENSTRLHFIVAATIAELDAEIAAFDRLLLFFALGLCGVFLVGTFIQVGFGLRPLRFLTKEVRGIKEGSQNRLERDYPQEINPLAVALNQLLGEYADLLARARRSAGDLAHGLKTPIAVIGLELDKVKFDPLLCRKQLQTMQRLIDYHLARASAAGSNSRGEIRLNQLVADIVAVLQQQYAERGLDFVLQAEENPCCWGDQEDWEEMLGNLLENAAKWANSRVEIRLGAKEIYIADDGPGIPLAERNKVLERGQRLDENVPGSGLGLGIVAEIAKLYGLSLKLEESYLGGLGVRLGW